ncbi:hypothetical protein M422DRAFT_781596 [Sphaerobolus stellatus SS14]|uniref:DUF6534 domain-containing protein n=1 Tax=Sphaerobolus stellatus (strain SS14) TaxID=990650 RepID=A0A0C9V816_SPHS4|nr:hypothetical protein M422DRAFT_781596 [Sphaerobolus stellatus SS14]
MASIGGLKLDLASTYGAYTIATFISAMLLGVTVNQAYRYFGKYSDPPLIKITVASLLTFEILHSAFSIHAVYYYVIANFGNPLALLQNVWSADVNFGVIGLNVFVVHLSYALRIYYVSGKRLILPVILTMVSLCHASLGWYLTALLFKDRFIVNLPGTPETIAKVILSTAVGIDMTIAITLSLYLHRSRTGFKRTDKLINKLVIYTINNGVLTSAADIVALAFVFAEPDNLIFLAITQVIGNLYTNSLMALLNSRRSLKMTQKDNTHGSSTGLDFNSMPAQTKQSESSSSTFARSPMSVQKLDIHRTQSDASGKERGVV